MVHAVNPVGMNEYRRFNENNVDLNRNGIITVSNSDDDDSNDDSNSDSDSENVYSSFDDFLAKRDPNFAGYDDFHYLFAPDFEKDDYGDHGNLSLYETTLGYYAKAIPALAQHGMKALKRTMVAGQYHRPDGLMYGGREYQTSVRRLMEFFEEDRPEFFRDSPSLVWIDVHTGLGPFGKDSVLRHSMHEEKKEQEDATGSSSSSSSALPPKIENFLVNAYSVSSGGAKSEADAFKGYGLAEGMLMDFFAYRFRRVQSRSDARGDNEDNNNKNKTSSKSRGIFLLQEFGTLPTILVGRALILDNRLYKLRKRLHFANKEKGGQLDKEQRLLFSYRSPFLNYAFYPQSTEWRREIVQRGVALFMQSMEYSKARFEASRS